MIKRNVKDCVPISFTKISPTVPMDFYLIPKIAGHKNNGMLRRSKYDAYTVPRDYTSKSLDSAHLMEHFTCVHMTLTCASIRTEVPINT